MLLIIWDTTRSMGKVNMCKRVKFLSETEKNSSKTLPQHSKKRSEYTARDLQNWKGASLHDPNNNLCKKQVTFYFGKSSCKTIPRQRNSQCQ